MEVGLPPPPIGVWQVEEAEFVGFFSLTTSPLLTWDSETYRVGVGKGKGTKGMLMFAAVASLSLLSGLSRNPKLTLSLVSTLLPFPEFSALLSPFTLTCWASSLQTSAEISISYHVTNEFSLKA